mmetsp:Transcript_117643/g.305287  ORF Transcript_117643/g.305287 Transcript_117643/m.305287 type:complete len:118 (+) Transcript_117643:85-438(+)
MLSSTIMLLGIFWKLLLCSTLHPNHIAHRMLTTTGTATHNSRSAQMCLPEEASSHLAASDGQRLHLYSSDFLFKMSSNGPSIFTNDFRSKDKILDLLLVTCTLAARGWFFSSANSPK